MPELTLDRVPATKLQLECHDSSVEHAQKKNGEHHAVLGSALLLRACPLPARPQTVLPAGEKIVMPPIKSLALPELRLRVNYSQLPSQNPLQEWNPKISLPTNDQYDKRVAIKDREMTRELSRANARRGRG